MARRFFDRQGRPLSIFARRPKKQVRRWRNNVSRSAHLDLESLEPRWVMAAPGALDDTFSGDGLLVQDFGLDRDEEINATVVQSDGKIIVAGSTKPAGGPDGQRDSFVARYHANGTLDTTFGSNGYAQFNVGGGDLINDVAIDSVGRIVVAGSASNGIVTSIAVARLTTNGQLDTSFSGDGMVITMFQSPSLENISSAARAVAIDAGGKIVVAGIANNSSMTTNSDFAVARYNSDGTLDTFFGGSGYITSDFFSVGTTGLTDEAWDVAVQNDGKIIAIGFATSATSQDFALIRYNVNGTLDTSFDSDGKVTTNVAPAFTTSTDTASSVLLEPDGQIVVGGFATVGNNNNIDFVIARYNTNGTLDPTLIPASPTNSALGTVRIQMGTVNDFARGLILQPQPDGKYVIGGEIGTLAPSTIFGIARVLPNGQLDTTFSNDGMVTTAFPGSTNHVLNDLVMSSDGRIIAAGHLLTTGGNRDIAIARYESGLLIADAGGPFVINEPGGSVTLAGSGTGSGLTFAWDLDGDSIFGESGAAAVNGNENGANPVFTVSGVDGPNNSYSVTLRVTDSTSFQAFDSAVINILNVAPTLAISGASTVNEGSSYTLNLSSSDPGADTITSWTINWGDVTEVVSGNPASVTHTYADGSSSYTISATATDEDGTYTAGNTVAVTVGKVDPTLAISGASTVNEGSSYTLNLSSTDPGADTITSWTINWGDVTEVVSGNPASVTHTYADGSSSYTISATATDEDGTYTAGNTVAVTVDNVDPTANAGDPYFTFDDTAITLTGSGADVAGAADPLSYAWDLDNNGTFETLGKNAAFDPQALGYTGSQTRTVNLQVTDGNGGIAVSSTTVEILGVGTAVVGSTLHIVGSNSNDIVIITQVGSDIMVIASFNSSNPTYFNASSITDIQLRVRGGHDIVVITPNITKTMTIDGGTGNDLLTAGGGDNVIYGGDGHDIIHGSSGDDIIMGDNGNDDLFGGSGNDIVVGGNGDDILDGGTGRDVVVGSQDEDRLKGGGDEDILIGGYTLHDANVAALDAIMAVWGSSDCFSARIATLTGSGGLLQAGVTVFDDEDDDRIIGDAGRDLIFGDTNPWDGAVDQISLNALQDVLVAVNC